MTSEAEDLARLRAWLREALTGLGLDRAARAEPVLAVGELCVAPDLETAPDHGLGIHLVHRIADSVAIDVRRERGTPMDARAYRRLEEAPADLEYLAFAAQPMVPEAPAVESSHPASA